MECLTIKKELIRLLRNNKKIKFVVDDSIRGVSGVKHKVDIHIVDPCDLALVITHYDLKIEVIKAVVISIDIHMPIILLVNENNFLRYKEELSEILETISLKIITYSDKEQDLMKVYYKVVEECEKAK
ncbi:MAG: hypothetical protein DRO23_04490 [Thermoprotei archaeon]|nr:MAG: hypothetical protein DRO23_04490 [Thermoprotei archaeon]